MRVDLIGDGITRSGDPVRRWVAQGDLVVYTDYSECGMWAGAQLWRQGWKFENVYWSADVLDGVEVRAFGTGLWDAGEIWVGGNYAWAKEYKGKRVERR